MPPAAVAGGGGVFAPGRGVSVFFQSATTALARGGEFELGGFRGDQRHRLAGLVGAGVE